MTREEALEDIVLYLNATEPKGLYCENIEVIKQDLERLEKLEKENQELRKIKEKAICEMQKARKKMDFYAQSEQYKEMYAYFNGVYKGLQEVLKCQKD